MPARAIVFDFDGVIVDSEPAHAGAIEAALAEFGMSLPGKQEYGRYIGRGDRECFAEVAKERGRELRPDDMERLVGLKAVAFLAAARSGVIRPYAGTVALLREAADAGPVGVCSGSMRESVEPVLELLGLRNRVRVLVTASDVLRNKPDPEPYLLAAARLGLDAGRCIAVEDSPAGIRSARDAGYTVHAVCHSFGRERLGEAHRVHESAEGLRIEDLLGDGAQSEKRIAKSEKLKSESEPPTSAPI